MGHGSCERPVCAHGGRIAVRGCTHEAVPVFEVSQLGGIYFVDCFSGGGKAVPAAPKPVSAFGNEVHFRHFPADGHAVRNGIDLVQHPHDHQIVVALGVDDGGPVQGLQFFGAEQYFTAFGIVQGRPGQAGNLYAVVFCKGLSDSGAGDLHIGRSDAHPHLAGLAPLFQSVRDGRGVQPQFHVGRGFRRTGLDIVHVVVGRIIFAQAEPDIPLRHRFCVEIAIVRQVPCVDILPVRQDDDIGAHGNKLLHAACFFRSKAHFYPVFPHAEGTPVHIAKGILGNKSSRRSGLGNDLPPLPLGENWVSVPSQVPHIVEFTGSDPVRVVVTQERIHHFPPGIQFLQCWVSHGHPP